MTFFSMLYSLTIDILTFWMPVVYTFKFLMDKDMDKIPVILKFWCMISVYSLISILLSQLLDDNIFPLINLAALISLNIPPYEITQKLYNNTLGALYIKNRKTFQSIQQTIIKIFDKNSQALKNKMKDSTGQKIKGVVGNILMSTLTATRTQSKKIQNKKDRDSDDDQDN